MAALSDASTVVVNDEATVEETSQLDLDALSRQVAVFDVKSQLRVSAASVLISGMGLLGLEIAKNICLSGPRSVTIHDDELATLSSAAANFFYAGASGADDGLWRGRTRAEVSLERLRALNPSVTVHCVGGAGMPLAEVLAGAGVDGGGLGVAYDVVILCDAPLAAQLEANALCRGAGGAKFLSASCRGVFGWAFADFGDGFVTKDKDGEQLKEVMVGAVSSASPPVVSTALVPGAGEQYEHVRHKLEDGDVVTFRGSGGTGTGTGGGGTSGGGAVASSVGPSAPSAEDALVGKYFYVRVLDPYRFELSGADGRPWAALDLQGGLTCVQAKVSAPVPFLPLSAALRAPGFLEADMFKAWNRWPPALLHRAVMAIDGVDGSSAPSASSASAFSLAAAGGPAAGGPSAAARALPRAWNAGDADAVLARLLSDHAGDRARAEALGPGQCAAYDAAAGALGRAQGRLAGLQAAAAALEPTGAQSLAEDPGGPGAAAARASAAAAVAASAAEVEALRAAPAFAAHAAASATLVPELSALVPAAAAGGDDDAPAGWTWAAAGGDGGGAAACRRMLSAVRLLCFTARGLLPPLCAALGGLVAQEALKAVMGKFTPLSQFLYLGAEEVVPPPPGAVAAASAPLPPLAADAGGRATHGVAVAELFRCPWLVVARSPKDRAVFLGLPQAPVLTGLAMSESSSSSSSSSGGGGGGGGGGSGGGGNGAAAEPEAAEGDAKDEGEGGAGVAGAAAAAALAVCVGYPVVNRLAQLRVFVVGAGAIGCELLKNLALLRVATDSDCSDGGGGRP